MSNPRGYRRLSRHPRLSLSPAAQGSIVSTYLLAVPVWTALERRMEPDANARVLSQASAERDRPADPDPGRRDGRILRARIPWSANARPRGGCGCQRGAHLPPLPDEGRRDPGDPRARRLRGTHPGDGGAVRAPTSTRGAPADRRGHAHGPARRSARLPGHLLRGARDTRSRG